MRFSSGINFVEEGEGLIPSPARSKPWYFVCIREDCFGFSRQVQSVDDSRGAEGMSRISAYDIFRFALLFAVSAAYFMFFA
jgi:hypothetical protein